MAKFKASPLADRSKRLGAVGAFGALAAAFAGKAAAQAAEAPAGFDPLSALGEIKEVTELADGTLEVVLANGKTIIVSAADFVVIGSEYFIAESAVATLLAVPGGLGAGAVLGGVGAAGVVGAVAGSGGGGDDAPPVSPPPPPPPPPAAPVFTSGTTATFAENGTGTVYTAAATDADSPALTYSITGGADASRFTINAATGVVTFVAPPNFEAPADVGANNVYDLQITASDGANTAVRSVAVTVTNVNDVAPVFTSGTTATFAENGTGTVYTAATDADSTSVTYAITGGADAQLFAINATTGVVTFVAAPNFDAPADDGKNNVYDLQITASDGTLSTVQTVAVTVTDINDEAPAFNSGTAVTFAENGTGTVYTAAATDADSATVTYAITGGADAARFAIDTAMGVVTFVTPPDFEAPADAGTNNVYDIQITASDGTNTSVRNVAVTVTDVSEAPQVIDLTTLSASQGFIIQGDASGDIAGVSVSTAGDINGDGFDDLIIGASYGDDGGTIAGEAYVLFGGAGGFGTADGADRRVIDLTSLSASQGFIIQGDAAYDRLGRSVSSAGDVNGDGFDDLIVGAPFGDDGGSYAGEAYVVFGGAGSFGTAVTANGATRQVIDLTSLSASQGFIIQGDAAYDGVGQTVSSAGDVNGDGFDDLIVGADRGDDGGYNAGEAYVMFGGAGSFGTAVTANGASRRVIDLTTLSASQGFIIQGNTDYNNLGNSVSSAGDVNGDGFDDLIVGVRYGDVGGADAGEAYVVFGTAGGFGTVDGSGRRVIDLATLSASQGFIIQGDTAEDNAGSAVSSAGDINGDGYDDLIVGAALGDDGDDNAGEAYVVFGGAGGFGTPVGGRQIIDLTTLSASQGFIIQGSTAYGNVGNSVSSAGDVNGDGFDDLIVGALGGNDSGTAYVVFGSASGFGTTFNTGGFNRQVIDLTSLTADQGFIIEGDAAYDQAGRSVSSAGDVNGDGFDDLIVGARGGDDGGYNAGEGYVIFGGATGTESTVAVLRTGTGSADNFTGNAGNDTFTGIGANDVVRGGAGDDAISLSATGFADIDGGRGTDTLSLSGTGLTLNLTGAGTARIQSIEVIDLAGAGNNTVVLDQQAVFDLTEERSGGDATLTIRGNAGDITNLGGAGGGFVANGTVTDSGVTYNIYTNGNANVRVQTGVTALSVPPPAQVIDLTNLSASQGFIIQGDTVLDNVGRSVSLAGDFNGDGFDDLIVGVAYGDDGGPLAGEAYVVFGGAGGFGTAVSGRQMIDLTTLAYPQGFIIQGDATGDNAGISASSAGDVNGDGIDDLIVGARGGDDGGNYAGESYVVFGAAGTIGSLDGSGRTVIDLTSLSASQGFIIQGDEAGNQSGRSVSSAGDVNGDGFDDLIVGAYASGVAGFNAGEAYVVFGGSGGFGTADGAGRRVIDLTRLSASQGFVIQGDAAYDQAGASVSSAGDVNGDGFDDLIIGAPFGDDGAYGAGEAYVVFGGAGGFGTTVNRGGFNRQVIDLTSLSASQGFIIEGEFGSDRAGRSVSSAGDVNGDGFDDLIVGAPGRDFLTYDVGEAYVVFGSASGFGTTVNAGGFNRRVIDSNTLSASQGFVLRGTSFNAYAGVSVSSAGDVNGDGFDDLIVGERGNSTGGTNAGASYVIYGGAGTFGATVAGRQLIELANITTAQGFVIQGDTANDRAGSSVSSAGDVNGDGFDDLIVGAPYGDDGGNNAGESYVIFGGATGTESTAAVTRTGTASADNFTGNAGDDTFTGIDANDVVRGGAGNDSISLSATAFADIDGGTGTDTLVLSGAGFTLNLTGAGTARIQSIELIDLTGTGNNALTLDQQAVFDLTEERSGGNATLTIRGNAGDSVYLTELFTAGGSVTEGGVTYNVFTRGNATLRVEQGVAFSSSAEVADPDPKGAQVAEPMGIASDWESAPTFGTATLEVLEDQSLDLNSGFGGTAGGFDAGDVWTPPEFAIEGRGIIDGGAADLAIQLEAQLAADLLLIDAALATQGN